MMMNDVATQNLPVPMTPMAMIDRALSSGASPETLGKLMDLQERWESAQAKKIYDEAMKQAQAEMRPVLMNANNSQTNSRYATYEALDNAIRPIYTRHGFSLSFNTADCPLENHIRIVCEVACGGHSTYPHIDMPADGKGAKGGDVMTRTHATGAAVTYGRRYLLGMIFNITITKDDDGNGAGGNPDMLMTVTADQFTELRDLLEQSASKEDDMLNYVKAKTVEEMTIAQYAKAKGAMMHKINHKKQKETK
jgi:ERF superfamily